MLNVLDRLVGEYGSECARVRQNNAIAEGQLRDYQARLGAEFLHEAYLTKLTGLRDRLRDGLSGKTAAAAGETPLDVPELADRVRALRDAHGIHTAPERVAGAARSAGESVVTRIRRRMAGGGASGSAVLPSAESPPDASQRPPTTFARRIATRRPAPPGGVDSPGPRK